MIYRLCQAGFDQGCAEGLTAVLWPLSECGLAGELAIALQVGQGADNVLRGIVKGNAASTIAGLTGGQGLAVGEGRAGPVGHGHTGGRHGSIHRDIATCCRCPARGYSTGGAGERAVLGEHVLQ